MSAFDGWIASNSTGSMWHGAIRVDVIGPVTGKVLSTHWVTAYSGRALGGPWGQTRLATLPPGVRCARCTRIAGGMP